MLKLRELTMEQHKNAERSSFAKKLVSGEVSPSMYVVYLYNMGYVYHILETVASQAGVLTGLSAIRRAEHIWSDYEELVVNEKPVLLNTVQDYMDYVIGMRNDKERLLAHLYVRHMGDMSGGQIIAKKVPGQGRYYKFKSVDKLKDKLRERLNNDMAEEAKIAFDFANDIFIELDGLDDLG